MPENHPNQVAVFGVDLIKIYSDTLFAVGGGMVRSFPIAQGAVLGLGLGFNQAISTVLPPLPPHLVAPVGAWSGRGAGVGGGAAARAGHRGNHLCRFSGNRLWL